MKHRPRKRFGQNFLHNSQIIHAIVNVFNPQPDDNVIEIGPGLGALTKPLLTRLHALTAIEIDTDLQTHLATMPGSTDKLRIMHADALAVDYSQFGERMRLIGNLPYNISTPLLLHLLHYIHRIEDMHFMLQKEVVDRLVSGPGRKTYGRLSVITQYHCVVEHVLDVSPSAFYPQPNVQSAVVRLLPHRSAVYPPVAFSALEKLVAQAFSMRRKTLANNLKSIMSIPALNDLRIDLGIDTSLRPEQISVADYVRMANYLANT